MTLAKKMRAAMTRKAESLTRFSIKHGLAFAFSIFCLFFCSALVGPCDCVMLYALVSFDVSISFVQFCAPFKTNARKCKCSCWRSKLIDVRGSGRGGGGGEQTKSIDKGRRTRPNTNRTRNSSLDSRRGLPEMFVCRKYCHVLSATRACCLELPGSMPYSFWATRPIEDFFRKSARKNRVLKQRN